MENARAPPKRRYGRTPVDDPNLTESYKKLFKRYTKVNRLSKTAALEEIAKEFLTSRTTVAYHIFPDFRSARLKRKKGKTRHKKTTEYRLRDSTIHHVHNNIKTYIQRVFERASYHPLSIDDIRYGIIEILVDDNLPKVLLRGTTLIKLIEKHENKTGKIIIEKFPNTQVLYKYCLMSNNTK